MIRHALAAIMLAATLGACASMDEFIAVMAELESSPPDSQSSSASQSTPQPDAARMGRFSSSWDWVSPSTGAYDLNAVEPTGDGYVAGGDHGAYLRSQDGETWEFEQLAAGNIAGVAYGDGNYVIAGDLSGAPLHFSWDGRDWYVAEFNQSVDSGFERLVRNVTWTGSYFLADAIEREEGRFGGTGVSYRSADGHHWDRLSLPSGSGGRTVFASVNGLTYMGTSNSPLRYSRDSGETWEEIEAVGDRIFSGITGVAYNEHTDRWIAVRTHSWMAESDIYESSDGIDWEHFENYEDLRFISVAAFDSGFLIGQEDEDAASLYQLIDRELAPFDAALIRSDGLAPHLGTFAHSNGTIVGVGTRGSIAAFTDSGSVLSVHGGNDFAGLTVNSVTRDGNGRYVAVGNEASIFTSNDGATWNSVDHRIEAISSSDNLRQVLWTGNGFAAQGSSVGKVEPQPLVFVSTDGHSWVASNANRVGATLLDRLVPGENGRYIGIGGAAVSDGQQIYMRYSNVFLFEGAGEDYRDFQHVNDYAFRDGVYDGSRFLLVGDEGAVAISETGQSWEMSEMDTSARLSSIVYFNDRYIATTASFAQEHELWISSDGTNWELHELFDSSWAGFRKFKEVDGILYGLADGQLWRTTDGEQWERETIPGGVEDIYSGVDGRLYAVGVNGMLLARH